MKNKFYRKWVSASAAALAASAIISFSPLDVEAQSATHTVQAGEYLLSIANQYGVTVDQLRSWNGLTNDLIDIGDVLVVYSSSTGNDNTGNTSNGVHTVQAGQTLYDIANAYGVTVSELMAWNGLSTSMIDVGDQLVLYGSEFPSTDVPPANDADGVHTVQAGQTLFEIARAYGVTVNDLMTWNGLSSTMIDVGDQLALYGVSVPETPTTPSDGVHTVSVGETLYDIARYYGVTVNQLMAWNGLSSTMIYPGNQLVLYGTDNGGSTETPPSGVYVVQSGDYLYSIAYAHGVSVAELRAWNNLASDMIYPGEQLYVSGASVVDPTPETPGTYHTVSSGDTLYDIARRYGVSVSDLMAWNGLSSSYLNVGDQLIYYSEATTPITPTTPTTPEESTESTEETSQSSSESTESSADESESASDETDSSSDESGDDEENGDETTTEEQIHEVEEGETLWSIANMYDVTVHNLRVWNELESDVLLVGQELVILDPVLEPKVHIVEAGDNLYSIAEEYETSEENIMLWNNLTDNTLQVDQELFVSDPDPLIHTVEPGETLTDIANEYSITVENIRTWNQLPENTLVVNGDLLVSDPTGMQ